MSRFSLVNVFVLAGLVVFLALVAQIPRRLLGSIFDGLAALVELYSVLIVVYTIKYRLNRVAGRKAEAIIIYVVALFLLLPYVYWRDLGEEGIRGHFGADWLAVPVLIFAVPTVTFVVMDIHKRWSGIAYCCKAVVECVVIVPLWLLLWCCAMYWSGWLWWL